MALFSVDATGKHLVTRTLNMSGLYGETIFVEFTLWISQGIYYASPLS